MAFFDKPLICYLSSKSLEILTSNNNQKFPFPPELVQHSELVDENKFGEALLQFLDQINLKKGKGVIVLSPKTVFSGEINISDKIVDDPVEQFLSSVPLARNNISSVIIKNKNNETIYATNRQLYEIIVKILNQKSIQIYSIVPVTAFQDILDNTELNIELIKKKIGNKKIVAEYNFLQTRHPVEVNSIINKSEVAITENENQNMRKQYIMLLISLLMFAGAVVYFLLWSGTIVNPWFKKDTGVSPKITLLTTPTPMVSSQPSPTVKLTDKSLLKIQILNGSGIEGQAGKLSLILQDGGYKNITTGNASNSAKLTKIIYSKSLSVDTPKDLADTLKKDLPNIVLQEASQSADFDIIITTGSGQQ